MAAPALPPPSLTAPPITFRFAPHWTDSFESYDLVEGVAAFVEKRKANFIGQ